MTIRKESRGGEPRWVIDIPYRTAEGKRARFRRDAQVQTKLGAEGEHRRLLAELGRSLQDDPGLQWQVNRFARRTVVGVVTRYGAQIAQLVSETVRRWDTGTLVTRLEGAVGRDLQFIRINGTLVGGLVGVAIHAISQWL